MSLVDNYSVASGPIRAHERMVKVFLQNLPVVHKTTRCLGHYAQPITFTVILPI